MVFDIIEKGKVDSLVEYYYYILGYEILWMLLI